MKFVSQVDIRFTCSDDNSSCSLILIKRTQKRIGDALRDNGVYEQMVAKMKLDISCTYF